jgi:cytochrome c553
MHWAHAILIGLHARDGAGGAHNDHQTMRTMCPNPNARHHCPDMMPDMIRSTNRFPLLAGCLSLFAVFSAHAQTPATGSAERGKQLTYTCQGCHGITGYKNAYPSYQVPKITGQTSEYLVNALSEYKQGARKHPTMQAQAQSFSEQDIADIAAYLSSLKK